jgi:peptidoglycan/xylan/chitin deacetylase (PgdA/CDA1 family)
MRRFFITAVIFMAIFCTAVAVFLPSAYVTPILMYHNIDQKEDMLSVSPQDFKRHLEFLKRHGYNVIGLGELADLTAGLKKVPPKTVVITFDDGRENNFTNAYPLLKKYNMPATIFVIPNHCGWQGYLTKQQIRQMAQDGIDIGSHTLNDVWLPDCDEAKLNEEIAGSKKALQEITQKRVDFISYPLGGFNQRVRLAVMRAGYKAACATNPGRYSAANDLYALKRLKVSGKNAHNMLSFWFKTTGFATWFKEHRHRKRQ